MEIYIIMGFVWLIGGLYSCGKAYAQNIARNQKQHTVFYLLDFVLWPFNLGIMSESKERSQ